MYFLSKYRRGIYNRYRKGMPWPEMLHKDLVHWWFNVVHFLAGRPVHRVLAYPHYPSKGSTIARIARRMDWEVTNKPTRRFTKAIYWEYATIREEFEALEKLNAQVINLDCRNISKDYVDEKMHEAFGYSTRIDPKTFEGIAVRKSLKNAVHDGTEVQCPLEPEEGFIYQRLIDSSVNDNEVMDLRVPVMKGHIPLVYLNYRVKSERFKNVPDRAELSDFPMEMLSALERKQIATFAELIGMQYGELDALRDQDGVLYIVDANNTPQGPPKHLPRDQKQKAIGILTKAFQENF